MGGLGSGLRKSHLCIESDCLTLDTSWLKKHKHFSQPLSVFEMQWSKWKEGNFKDRTTQTYSAGVIVRMGEQPTLTLCYQTRSTNPHTHQAHTHGHDYSILLISTPCGYGGLRWWFQAPCCGCRVRVLYLNIRANNVEQVTPQCRNCADLHYASQCSSYIEKHITYEKDLLRNYGYSWAQIEYECMRQHYFKVTPEWEYVKQCSIFERELELLRHYITFVRVLMRTHTRDLLSLKSQEDRRTYVDHIAKEHGQQYALDLVRLVQASMQVERDAFEMSPAVFEQFYCERVARTQEGRQAEQGDTTMDLAYLIKRREQREAKLAALKARYAA